jgi:hypothetical protein
MVWKKVACSYIQNWNAGIGEKRRGNLIFPKKYQITWEQMWVDQQNRS